jgi:hypothetical protein
MTLRELIRGLQAQDEKSLDKAVLVSPASGECGGISHLSTLFVGTLLSIFWSPHR